MSQRPGDARACRKCHMALVFLEGKSGPDRPMPGQPVRSIYVRDGDHARKVTVTRLVRDDGTVLEAEGGLELFVNHYETCPHAGDFHSDQRARGRGSQAGKGAGSPRSR